jgi:hypothetical protein
VPMPTGRKNTIPILTRFLGVAWQSPPRNIQENRKRGDHRLAGWSNGPDEVVRNAHYIQTEGSSYNWAIKQELMLRGQDSNQQA